MHIYICYVYKFHSSTTSLQTETVDKTTKATTDPLSAATSKPRCVLCCSILMHSDICQLRELFKMQRHNSINRRLFDGMVEYRTVIPQNTPIL